MLWHVELVVVPGLWSDEVGASPNLHVQRRAAITAEDADDVVAAVGFRDIALWRALEDAEPRAKGRGRQGRAPQAWGAGRDRTERGQLAGTWATLIDGLDMFGGPALRRTQPLPWQTS